MADLVVKQGDSGGKLQATIVDQTGLAVDLTGATVTCVIRQMVAVSPSTDAAATIDLPHSGEVSYTLTAADTAVAGLYQAEFHVITADNIRYTYPRYGWLEIEVQENLVTPGGARLVGLGETKDYLNISAADRSQDGELLRFIDAVTPVVEFITGPLLQRQIVGEIYDGGRPTISLRNKPVVHIDAVVEYEGNSAYNLSQVISPELGETYSYTFEPPGTIVRRTVGGGTSVFGGGPGSVYVSYTAGVTSVPPNVRMGTLELLRVNYQPTQQSGRPGFGGGGGDASDPAPGQYLGFFIPGRVRELLAPNKRHPRIA